MADYTVTGAISPAMDGTYTQGADVNGYPAFFGPIIDYLGPVQTRLNFSTGVSRYVLATSPTGAIWTTRFTGPEGGAIEGTYTPSKGSSGNPVVSALGSTLKQHLIVGPNGLIQPVGACVIVPGFV